MVDLGVFENQVMILLDEPHLRIEFKNVPCRHLLTIWSGTMKSEEYRQGVSTILKCCRENEIRKIVSDIRRQDVVQREDQQFAAELMKAHVAKHGLFFQAIVLASDVFIKFSAANFERAIAQRQHMSQYFANEKDALNWLMEVDL